MGECFFVPAQTIKRELALGKDRQGSQIGFQMVLQGRALPDTEDRLENADSRASAD